jgi:indolepyruvate ferredoxin oxidoreductase beta subunit
MDAAEGGGIMAISTEKTRPVTLLIAALGGEGGGVLTNWVVNAARSLKLPVQSTSIPGVAQRTGATTYYVEIWPKPLAGPDDPYPVFSLSPTPGEVDLVISSELLEAGRTIANGFVTPDRTFLISSTHRVLTTKEKMAMSDGEFDTQALHRAVTERSQDRLLFDVAATAADAGSIVNSVMLGAIAGTDRLPIPVETFEAAIEAEGKAVASNLSGFRSGLAIARNESQGGSVVHKKRSSARVSAASLLDEMRQEFPKAAHEVMEHGIRRLVDFQDARYAKTYLDRLMPFRDGNADLLTTIARHLAVRMSFEDIVRVAALKIRPERVQRIRTETQASANEPVKITEFFKPGIGEISDMMPPWIAKRLLARAERKPNFAKKHWPMEIQSTSLWGFSRIWFLAKLRRFRRKSYRYGVEQAAIEQWLGDLGQAAALDTDFANELAECARLIKGYGDTHRRGSQNFARIRNALVLPALEAKQADGLSGAVAKAREAALADPDGEALSAVLTQLSGKDEAHPETQPALAAE